MSPAEVAERYIACVRARDLDGWMDLFADDAVYRLPNGTEFAGKVAIREFQAKVFGSGAPFPTPVGRLVDGNRMAVQVQAQLPDGTVRHTANVYTLGDDGRIALLEIYARG